MSKEARDFWNKELEGVNMEGFGHRRNLSPTDIKVIRERCKFLGGRKRKASIIEFSRRLGATEEEIELDILPSLNL